MVIIVLCSCGTMQLCSTHTIFSPVDDGRRRAVVQVLEASGSTNGNLHAALPSEGVHAAGV